MENKKRIYEELITEIQSVLAGENDPIAWMSTLSCLIRNKTGHFWVGFYRVRGKELVIGPYQGTLGCLHIPFGKGVCGTCAEQRRTLVVPDVHQFPGHIACDSRSNSEIVVPVFDGRGRLKAVLDMDSTSLAVFDETDRTYLEKIAGFMAGLEWEIKV